MVECKENQCFEMRTFLDTPVSLKVTHFLSNNILDNAYRVIISPDNFVS